MLKNAIEEINIRCKQAGIEFGKSESDDEDNEYWEVKMPAGREKKSIYIWYLEDAINLLDIEFENYICFHEYAVICSYKLGIIEACIQMPSRMSPTIVRRRLYWTSFK